ncbi:MAG: hypothetical protein ACP5N2_04885 [Candidatus Nanoarchaeia archaeon]
MTQSKNSDQKTLLSRLSNYSWYMVLPSVPMVNAMVNIDRKEFKERSGYSSDMKISWKEFVELNKDSPEYRGAKFQYKKQRNKTVILSLAISCILSAIVTAPLKIKDYVNTQSKDYSFYSIKPDFSPTFDLVGTILTLTCPPGYYFYDANKEDVNIIPRTSSGFADDLYVVGDDLIKFSNGVYSFDSLKVEDSKIFFVNPINPSSLYNNLVAMNKLDDFQIERQQEIEKGILKIKKDLVEISVESSNNGLESLEPYEQKLQTLTNMRDKLNNNIDRLRAYTIADVNEALKITVNLLNSEQAKYEERLNNLKSL